MVGFVHVYSQQKQKEQCPSYSNIIHNENNLLPLQNMCKNIGTSGHHSFRKLIQIWGKCIKYKGVYQWESHAMCLICPDIFVHIVVFLQSRMLCRSVFRLTRVTEILYVTLNVPSADFLELLVAFHGMLLVNFKEVLKVLKLES